MYVANHCVLKIASDNCVFVDYTGMMLKSILTTSQTCAFLQRYHLVDQSIGCHEDSFRKTKTKTKCIVPSQQKHSYLGSLAKKKKPHNYILTKYGETHTWLMDLPETRMTLFVELPALATNLYLFTILVYSA